MIGQYLLKQLNQLRSCQSLCDLDLIAMDGEIFPIHHIVFAALNQKHFNLHRQKTGTEDTSQHVMKKMLFPHISSEELKILVLFMYGVPVRSKNRYDLLLSVLHKAGMSYLLDEAGGFTFAHDSDIKTEQSVSEHSKSDDKEDNIEATDAEVTIKTEIETAENMEQAICINRDVSEKITSANSNNVILFDNLGKEKDVVSTIDINMDVKEESTVVMNSTTSAVNKEYAEMTLEPLTEITTNVTDIGNVKLQTSSVIASIQREPLITLRDKGRKVVIPEKDHTDLINKSETVIIEKDITEVSLAEVPGTDKSVEEVDKILEQFADTETPEEVLVRLKDRTSSENEKKAKMLSVETNNEKGTVSSENKEKYDIIQTHQTCKRSNFSTRLKVTESVKKHLSDLISRNNDGTITAHDINAAIPISKIVPEKTTPELQTVDVNKVGKEIHSVKHVPELKNVRETGNGLCLNSQPMNDDRGKAVASSLGTCQSQLNNLMSATQVFDEKKTKQSPVSDEKKTKQTPVSDEKKSKHSPCKKLKYLLPKRTLVISNPGSGVVPLMMPANLIHNLSTSSPESAKHSPDIVNQSPDPNKESPNVIKHSKKSLESANTVIPSKLAHFAEKRTVRPVLPKSNHEHEHGTFVSNEIIGQTPWDSTLPPEPNHTILCNDPNCDTLNHPIGSNLNYLVQLNSIPVNLNQVPVSSNQIPVNFNQSPISLNQIPVNLNQIPVSSNQIPVNLNQIPVSLNQIPVSSNQIPVSSNQIPGSSNQIPVNLNKFPVSSNQIPVNLNHIPVSLNQIPLNLNQAPCVAANQHPIYSNDLPSGAVCIARNMSTSPCSGISAVVINTSNTNILCGNVSDTSTSNVSIINTITTNANRTSSKNVPITAITPLDLGKTITANQTSSINSIGISPLNLVKTITTDTNQTSCRNVPITAIIPLNLGETITTNQSSSRNMPITAVSPLNLVKTLTTDANQTNSRNLPITVVNPLNLVKTITTSGNPTSSRNVPITAINPLNLVKTITTDATQTSSKNVPITAINPLNLVKTTTDANQNSSRNVPVTALIPLNLVKTITTATNQTCSRNVPITALSPLNLVKTITTDASPFYKNTVNPIHLVNASTRRANPVSRTSSSTVMNSSDLINLITLSANSTSRNVSGAVMDTSNVHLNNTFMGHSNTNLTNTTTSQPKVHTNTATPKAPTNTMTSTPDVHLKKTNTNPPTVNLTNTNKLSVNSISRHISGTMILTSNTHLTDKIASTSDVHLIVTTTTSDNVIRRNVSGTTTNASNAPTTKSTPNVRLTNTIVSNVNAISRYEHLTNTFTSGVNSACRRGTNTTVSTSNKHLTNASAPNANLISKILSGMSSLNSNIAKTRASVLTSSNTQISNMSAGLTDTETTTVLSMSHPSISSMLRGTAWRSSEFETGFKEKYSEKLNKANQPINTANSVKSSGADLALLGSPTYIKAKQKEDMKEDLNSDFFIPHKDVINTKKPTFETDSETFKQRDKITKRKYKKNKQTFCASSQKIVSESVATKTVSNTTKPCDPNNIKQGHFSTNRKIEEKVNTSPRWIFPKFQPWQPGLVRFPVAVDMSKLQLDCVQVPTGPSLEDGENATFDKKRKRHKSVGSDLKSAKKGREVLKSHKRTLSSDNIPIVMQRTKKQKMLEWYGSVKINKNSKHLNQDEHFHIDIENLDNVNELKDELNAPKNPSDKMIQLENSEKSNTTQNADTYIASEIIINENGAETDDDDLPLAELAKKKKVSVPQNLQLSNSGMEVLETRTMLKNVAPKTGTNGDTNIFESGNIVNGNHIESLTVETLNASGNKEPSNNNSDQEDVCSEVDYSGEGVWDMTKYEQSNEHDFHDSNMRSMNTSPENKSIDMTDEGYHKKVDELLRDHLKRLKAKRLKRKMKEAQVKIFDIDDVSEKQIPVIEDQTKGVNYQQLTSEHVTKDLTKDANFQLFCSDYNKDDESEKYQTTYTGSCYRTDKNMTSDSIEESLTEESTENNDKIIVDLTTNDDDKRKSFVGIPGVVQCMPLTMSISQLTPVLVKMLTKQSKLSGDDSKKKKSEEKGTQKNKNKDITKRCSKQIRESSCMYSKSNKGGNIQKKFRSKHNVGQLEEHTNGIKDRKLQNKPEMASKSCKGVLSLKSANSKQSHVHKKIKMQMKRRGYCGKVPKPSTIAQKADSRTSPIRNKIKSNPFGLSELIEKDVTKGSTKLDMEKKLNNDKAIREICFTTNNMQTAQIHATNSIPNSISNSRGKKIITKMTEPVNTCSDSFNTCMSSPQMLDNIYVKEEVSENVVNFSFSETKVHKKTLFFEGKEKEKVRSDVPDKDIVKEKETIICDFQTVNKFRKILPKPNNLMIETTEKLNFSKFI